MIKIDLKDSYLYYDYGRFDRWCVYERFADNKKIIPTDIDYFNELLYFSQFFGKDRLYDDYVKIYDLTTSTFDDALVEKIRDISSFYGDYQERIFRLFSILYMVMIAEENKENSRLGKRIKRLGVHYLLKKNKSAEYSANFMRNVPWRILDGYCKEGGF